MLTAHGSSVAGAHFRLSCLHLVEQVCVQSAVPGSQQNDLVCSVQLVVLSYLICCVMGVAGAISCVCFLYNLSGLI